MGFVALHIEKAIGNNSGITAHIERKVIPPNADPSRTHLNRELLEFPEGVKDRTQAIQHRIDHAGLQRKIGKNQVRTLCVTLTGTHEDIQQIQEKGRLDEWCNDNLDWLRKTYGTENLVSAVLHLDERTPHIHATVVPIVTGERRKAKDTKDEPGKKKYRKKDSNTARLCADDVMARDKLKEYQDTYAIAMQKYGLKRGIEGSKARHISTTQYYRDTFVKAEQLMAKIGKLLEQQEQLIGDTEDLKRQKEEAQKQYTRADAQAKEKESELQKKQKELKQVKGQVKTEELKNSLANVATNLSDTVGSLFNSSKVKTLEEHNRDLRDQLDTLQVCIGEIEAGHEKQLAESRKELGRIYKLFPEMEAMLKMNDYCKAVGLRPEMFKNLIYGKTYNTTGELYSEIHRKSFHAEKSKINIERTPDNSFRLCVDGMEISQWFDKKYQETREATRPQVRQMQTPVMPKRQGIRM